MISLILALRFFAAFSLVILIVVIKVLAWLSPAYGYLVEPVFLDNNPHLHRLRHRACANPEVTLCKWNVKPRSERQTQPERLRPQPKSQPQREKAQSTTSSSGKRP